jgi:hypothetical protein
MPIPPLPLSVYRNDPKPRRWRRFHQLNEIHARQSALSSFRKRNRLLATLGGRVDRRDLL